MSRLAVLLAVLVLITAICACSCSEPQGPPPTGASVDRLDEADPLGPNGACYVCHMTFVGEELGSTHLRAAVPCTECHGLSAGHANNENIGATLPDRTFARPQVDAMCLECHDRHEMDQAKEMADAPVAVCTDCHGTHRIKKVLAAGE